MAVSNGHMDIVDALPVPRSEKEAMIRHIATKSAFSRSARAVSISHHPLGIVRLVCGLLLLELSQVYGFPPFLSRRAYYVLVCLTLYLGGIFQVHRRRDGRSMIIIAFVAYKAWSGFY